MRPTRSTTLFRQQLKQLRFPLLAVLLSLLALPVTADVYKWRDENGKLHFGDKPPTGNSKAEKLDIKQRSNTGNPTISDAERLKRQQRLLDSYAEDRNEKKAAAAKAQQEEKARKAACVQARDTLAEMQTAGYLYDLDEDGNRIILSDDVRNQRIDNLQGEIDANCR